MPHDNLTSPPPPPTTTATRSVDDLLQPGREELVLNAMSQLALLQTGDPRGAPRDARAYVAQLERKHLPTDGLAEFTEALFRDPTGLDWRQQIAEALSQVAPSRARIWLSLQAVWGIDDQPVAGQGMRRMDAILDLAGFPRSAQDAQVAVDGYTKAIADAKVRPETAVGLLLGTAALIGAGTLTGHAWTASGMALRGHAYIRNRLGAVDRESKALAQLLLAAEAAAIDHDGLPDVRALRQGLLEDLAVAVSHSPKRPDMMKAAATTLRAIESTFLT